MKTETRRLLLLALLACASLAACGEGDAADRGADDDPNVPEEERFGGTAVVAAIGDIPDINPLTSTDHTANQIQQFVLFTPLITYDEEFRPQPWLAESWELNDDTTAVTFHLRDDVYWHDGVKTTAYDLKFSYDLARDPETGFPNTAFWTHYGDAEAVDSFTFRVAMEPHADFLDPWRSFTPVPRHKLEGVGAAAMRTHPFSTREPLGNGPFKFVEHVSGQHWTFAANDRWPEELGGRPYLDRIVYRAIPEQTTLLNGLLTGEIDYYIAPPAEQAAEVEAASNVRLIHFPDRSFVIIGWNERRPMFEDRNVRRALTMAIDKQRIIDGILYGYGQVANSTVPPFFWQFDEQAGAGLDHDPEQARRLLDEAGWTDSDGDGVRDKDGRPFRFQMVTNQGNQIRADIIQAVQSDLRKVGIAVEPQVLEWGTLLDRINDPETRNFDAVVIGWVTEFRIDDSDLFHCDKMDDPYQWVSYCDPEADRLLDTLPRIVDRDRSLALWQRYQRKIASDQPYTFVYFQERLEGVSNRLRNVHPDARGDWYGAHEWFIMPGERRAGEAQASR